MTKITNFTHFTYFKNRNLVFFYWKEFILKLAAFISTFASDLVGFGSRVLQAYQRQPLDIHSKTNKYTMI